MNRLIRFMQKNRDKKVRFTLILEGYREDSIRTADLSEALHDTIPMQVEKQLVITDTLTGADSAATVLVDTFKVTTTYHNYKLEKQGKALARKLDELNVPADIYTIKITARENLLKQRPGAGEEPKVKVSVVFE